ncbi:uncharacterized protein FA14DRAFT_158439 [Meira miltonrushii]|uniref:Uncharacterized protein n=1 Tax=Meira miltonrushii TaxID=1280837 RepID=A0A316V241_9BASI|nr:uncharacterized protein FA14DRAFT_158439 [Meira miltonrushii]PWN31627.1 hypothetical protein FA14DRAFT_158439 [Meira miltonrushii]
MLLSIQVSLVVYTLALQVYSYGLDIDLNQPASPAEEPTTAEMMKSTDQRNYTIIKVSQPPKKQKTKEQRLSKKIRQKNWYNKLKKDPKKYEVFLKQKADYRKNWYSNFDESRKKEFRAEKRKGQLAYKQRKLEKDPNFKPFDRRKELRKRVREGTATKEDLQQYDELKAKHAAGQRASAQRTKEKKKTENIYIQ